MGRLNVKNTIVERVLQNIAPHHCSGCGNVGSLLCPYCKYDIIHEPFLGCIVCGNSSRVGICTIHDAPIQRSFVVSERSGVLEALIDGLKFHNVKAAAKDLAALLDERLPLLPEGTIIVPIPTVRSHIRQRGYDQVELIARHLAERRQVTIVRALERVGKDTQHKLGREDREVAAKRAFVLNSRVRVEKDSPILLLDDIITTGATVLQATQTLQPLGVPVFVSALAYQPLD